MGSACSAGSDVQRTSQRYGAGASLDPYCNYHLVIEVGSLWIRRQRMLRMW